MIQDSEPLTKILLRHFLRPRNIFAATRITTLPVISTGEWSREQRSEDPPAHSVSKPLTYFLSFHSIGIILYEVYSRKSPYEGEDFRDVLRKVCNRRINKRPGIPPCMPQKMVDLMKKCWSHDVSFRPQAKDLDVTLMDLSPQEAEPVLEEDSRLKKNTKDMLYELFPKHIADALKRGDKVDPEQHDLVTVVFSDIVHFTDLSHELTPLKVSQMLDRLYIAFDKIAKKHRVFKVEVRTMSRPDLERSSDVCSYSKLLF